MIPSWITFSFPLSLSLTVSYTHSFRFHTRILSFGVTDEVKEIERTRFGLEDGTDPNGR